jgi:hypothetical protein
MIDEPLDPELRELIAAGRDRLGPDAAIIARLRTRIDDAIAANGSAVTRSLAPKLVVVIAVAGIGISGYVGRRGAVPPTMSPAIATEQLEVPSVPTIRIGTHETVAPTSPVTTSRARTRVEPKRALALDTAPARVPSTVPADRPAEPAPAGRSVATLAREIELIDRASLLMRHLDMASALDTLRVYDRETSGLGQLAQDAAALGVEIRCKSKDDNAGDALAHFDRQYPRSAHTRRLTAVCRQANNKR